MNYGLKDKLDTAENRAWMKRTLRTVMKANPHLDKQSAENLGVIALRSTGNFSQAENFIERVLDRRQDG